MSSFPEEMRIFRDVLANMLLRGQGIEIGAGNVPIRFRDPATRPLYVDMATKDELVGKFGFPADWQDADLIEDGTELPSIGPNSVPYVIACHVLEHTQDPIRTLETWFSKISPRGLLFITIPHRDYGFDSNRPLTSTSHVFEDYNNSEWSEDGHLQEWAKIVNGFTDAEEIAEHKAKLRDIDYRIHYHVWDTNSFLDMLLEYRRRLESFDIEFYGRNMNEVIAVLRKSASI